MTPTSTVSRIRGAFHVVTVACVPAAHRLTPDGWRRAEAVVDDALARRPEGVRRQLVLFVRILGLLSRLRWGRGLEGAGPERVRRLLEGLEGAPLLLLRRGVWGLRTLAFMGVYGQPEVRRELGYAAAPGGWEVRGGTQGPWPRRHGAAPPEAGTLTAGGEERGAPHA